MGEELSCFGFPTHRWLQVLYYSIFCSCEFSLGYFLGLEEKG
jgi:hypothetical protein